MTVLHYFSLIGKCLLLLVLAPFILLWLGWRYASYRVNLRRHMIRCGVPPEVARRIMSRREPAAAVCANAR